jgi:hypothetical protein
MQPVPNWERDPVPGSSSTSQQVPVHNGRATGSLLVNPVDAGGFTCPSGQTLYLVSSCFENVSMNIGGATASDAGPVCSGPIMVKQ